MDISATPQHNLQAEFSAILDSLEGFPQNPTLAIAVSGGADSMALLLLAHSWAQSHGGKATALTVDHGLRKESAAEARWVAKQCQALGIEHHILTYHGNKPLRAIQETARTIRYGLLTEWCHKHDVTDLCTAHHLGDQAETMFFRLARGSGLTGLAGISAVTYRGEVRVLRPLLSHSKKQLIGFLKAQQQDWIEDPSNNNPAYTRTHIRNILADMALEPRIIAISSKLAHIRNVLEEQTQQATQQYCTLDPAGFVTLRYELLADVPPVTAKQLLSNILQTVSGSTVQPRSETIDRLFEDLRLMPQRRNAAGCMLQYKQKDHCFYITREAASTAAPLSLKTGVPTMWDNRFMVQLRSKKSAPEPLQVSCVGESGAKALKTIKISDHYRNMPPAVIKHFIAIWVLEELVCVPHINYYHPQYHFLECFAQFKPTKPLAGEHFYGMNKLVKYKEL